MIKHSFSALMSASVVACCALSFWAQTAGPPIAGPPRANPTKVTDRVWPAAPGEGAVCLWADDKLAAFSITIDDNTNPDVAWWLEKSTEMQLPLTWFIITDRVGTGGYWGTWDSWQKVRDAGHAIESHTVTHLSAIKDPNWKGIEWEYSESRQQIEAHIPGDRVRCLAFPGGTVPDLNDPTLAAKYYAAARSTRGTLNTPYNINYHNVNAMSGPSLDNPKTPYNDVRNLLNPADRYYRGWAVLIYHLVKDRTGQQKFFDFYTQNVKDLWGAKFGDVALYGQERDTAILKVGISTETHITFTLEDTKDNNIFDYPLTVKIRLPATWQKFVATQNGIAVEARIVEHEDGRYALVKAVPDRGIVTLQSQ